MERRWARLPPHQLLPDPDFQCEFYGLKNACGCAQLLLMVMLRLLLRLLPSCSCQAAVAAKLPSSYVDGAKYRIRRPWEDESVTGRVSFG
jgi:hypothetical protein